MAGRNKRIARLAFLNFVSGPLVRPAKPWQPRSLQMASFLDTIAKTPYRWRLDGEELRTYPDNDCPITANARHLTGRAFSTRVWTEAADAIGLPRDDGRLIVAAADNQPGHIPGLRARLIAATINRPAVPQSSAPAAPDPMDRALADLITKGIPAEPAGKELAAV